MALKTMLGLRAICTIGRRSFVLFTAFCVSPMLASAQQVQALEEARSAQEVQRVSVGFLIRQTDSDISQVLEEHGAIPLAAHIWSSGFSGSHTNLLATDQGSTVGEFIAHARQETINFFEEALAGNTHRLTTMLASRNRNNVIFDQDATHDLRSMLTLRSQFESVLREARNGDALIYGLEVEVASQEVAALQAHPIVHVSFVAGEDTTSAQIIQNIKPYGLGNDFVDAEVRSLSNEALYTRALSIVKN